VGSREQIGMSRNVPFLKENERKRAERRDAALTA
jgi:hypothetical protein